MSTVDEKLVIALARAITALERPISQHVTDAGFTPGQFAVLEALLHKGPRTVGQLIDDVLSSGGNIAVVVDNLIKAGLLRKTPVEGDGRKRLISLTDAGRRRISAYYPHHRNELARLFGQTDTATKLDLIRLLIGLRNDLAAATSSMPTPKER